jgi:hypothetical protein
MQSPEMREFLPERRATTSRRANGKIYASTLLEQT